MSEIEVPYKKHSSKTRKFRVPPPHDIPAPNHKRPPPTEPIPDEPALRAHPQVLTCLVYRMTFNSQEALQLHIANAHFGGPPTTER